MSIPGGDDPSSSSSGINAEEITERGGEEGSCFSGRGGGELRLL